MEGTDRRRMTTGAVLRYASSRADKAFWMWCDGDDPRRVLATLDALAEDVDEARTRMCLLSSLNGGGDVF